MEFGEGDEPEYLEDDDIRRRFGYEPEYIFEAVRKAMERKNPGRDKTAATLYLNLRNLLKVMPGLKEKAEELSKDPESEHVLELTVGENHWKYVANKDNVVGDFRLVRENNTGEVEEEAKIIINKDADNSFAYWNRSYARPDGKRFFRGQNEPAAKIIQGMITRFAKDGLS